MQLVSLLVPLIYHPGGCQILSETGLWGYNFLPFCSYFCNILISKENSWRIWSPSNSADCCTATSSLKLVKLRASGEAIPDCLPSNVSLPIVLQLENDHQAVNMLYALLSKRNNFCYTGKGNTIITLELDNAKQLPDTLNECFELQHFNQLQSTHSRLLGIQEGLSGIDHTGKVQDLLQSIWQNLIHHWRRKNVRYSSWHYRFFKICPSSCLPAVVWTVFEKVTMSTGMQYIFSAHLPLSVKQ